MAAAQHGVDSLGDGCRTDTVQDVKNAGSKSLHSLRSRQPVVRKEMTNFVGDCHPLFIW